MKKAVIILSCVIGMSAGAGYASAHEKRVVAGQFDIVVGFIHEPAFSGQLNGLDLRVNKTVTAEGIEGLEKTLTAVVVSSDGKEEMALTLHPKYKEPGHYEGHFIPVKPGKYVFRMKGEINKIPVNEVFESGKKFHDVEDSSPLLFPKT